MITIQLTMSGQTQRIQVEQYEVVQHCHYLKCRAEFTTIDPDQLYCRRNHKIYQTKLKSFMSRPVPQWVPGPASFRVKTPA